jgi:adenosylhomocysteine nucleosidase
MKSVGILVAMREELQPLRRHWNLDWTGPGDFLSGRWAGLRLQVALSGVGRQRAEAGVEKLLRYGKPDLLLSIGYSGALQPELRAGTCILADEVLSGEASWQTGPMSALERQFHGWQVGRVLCVDEVVLGKSELAGRFPGALAVDMESAAVACAAAGAALPWRALRVIVDDLQTELPLDFARCLNEDGQMHPGKLAREIARKPHRIPHLLRFSGHADRARRSLVENASRYLEVLSPW